jgi:hypothetical protein
MPSVLQRVGFWMLCALLVSGLVNEWSVRLLGINTYLLTVMLVLLPAVWLLSGSSLRGLRHPIGRWWLAFFVWLLLATPFSLWRAGSAAMLWDFVPRSYLLFFYTATLVTSLRYCRFLMWAYLIVAFGTLVTCIIWGTYSEDARFYVPGGLGILINANFVALSLLWGATQFIYLLYQRGIVKKLMGIAGICVAIAYMLKTGSRGCMLAAIICAIFFLALTHRRRVFLPVAAAAAAIGLLALPSTTLSRLVQVGIGDETDSSAEMSRLTRTELLKHSLYETATHPLFGVGPDQFAAQMAAEEREKGAWEPWLGTHDSYTQVSSECGVPALIFYVAVIGLCWRMNYRLFRTTQSDPKHAEMNALSASLLCTTLSYSVCNFFFHMAYTAMLPALAGLTLALYNSSRQILETDLGVKF